MASRQAPTLLTRRQLAAFLNVSIDTVNRLVHDPDHPLPRMQFGRRFLFDKEEVLRYGQRAAKLAKKRKVKSLLQTEGRAS